MHNGAIMPSEVRHRVEDGQAYPLVRLAGVLDLATAPQIRAALLDVLAEQPEALVVDVSELDLATPEATGVLREVRRDTADWPATRLALCDPRDASRWQATGWPVWPGSGDAFAALGSPALGTRVRLELDPALGAARRTRELITDACARWDLVPLAGPACIVATEMVNNVVAHARTSMIVLVAALGGGLSVAVRDASPTLPSYTGEPVAPTAYGGRGMLLIDSVASRWGSLVLRTGKIVWALMEAEQVGGQTAGRADRQAAGRVPADRRAGGSMAHPARG